MPPEDALANEILKRGSDLLQSFRDALVAWSAVPPAIIGDTKPKARDRTLSQNLAVRGARKLSEDVVAASLLLSQGLVGPAHALVRMCRENVTSIFYLFAAEAADAERFARYIAQQRPAAEQTRLHRVASKLLAEFDGRISDRAKSRLKAATLSEGDLHDVQVTSKQDSKAPDDFRFQNLVVGAIQSLLRNNVENAGDLSGIMIDYWMESEVVHSGFHALELYEINGGTTTLNSLCRLRSALIQMCDIRLIAVELIGVLLRSFDLIGRLPEPHEMQVLRVRQREAIELLAAVDQRISFTKAT
jgi:hypothetical protein